VEVLLGNVVSAIKGAARHGCVFAVQHHMILHVGALFDPVAASLGMRTLDYQLIEHGGDDLGHGASVCVLGAAGGATLLGLGSRVLLLCLLCFPRLETLSTEDVVALQLDRVGEGTMADEADLMVKAQVSRWPMRRCSFEAYQVCIRRRDILQHRQIRRLLGPSVVPARIDARPDLQRTRRGRRAAYRRDVMLGTDRGLRGSGAASVVGRRHLDRHRRGHGDGPDRIRHGSGGNASGTIKKHGSIRGAHSPRAAKAVGARCGEGRQVVALAAVLGGLQSDGESGGRVFM